MRVSTAGKPAASASSNWHVALHADLEVITKTQQLISNWLQDMGLELKPSKTRITHTLHPHEGNLGFDFLGFHGRQFQVGKTHSGKNPQGEILGFKTIIRPSDEAIQDTIKASARLLENCRTHPKQR
jgi:RNA-directed DNA polymerase